MTRKIYVIGCFLLTAFTGNTQAPTPDLGRLTEKLFQVQEDDRSYSELYDALYQYYLHPIDLNQASEEELLQLSVISPSQVAELIHYRQKYGDLLSIFELQAIPGFELPDIENLLPFVTVDENRIDNRPLLSRILSEPNHYLIVRYNQRLERARGFREQSYQGSPGNVYTRFRISHPHDFSLGFIAEKDAGEPFNLSSHGFDFYSGHFQVKNRGALQNLIVGDYQMQWGQGLVAGSGFGTGKGTETVYSVRRGSLGAQPYSSAMESGFFRGATLTLGTKKYQSTVFVSRLAEDGRVNNDTLDADVYGSVPSLGITGLHRTQKERESRNSIMKTTLGTALVCRPGHRMEAGLVTAYTHFSHAIVPSPAPYNFHNFQGHANTTTGTYFNWNYQNILLFGEAAISGSKGKGIIGGAMASLSHQLDVAIVFRRYDKNFHSFYANAFSESSRPSNETGYYWGVKYKPSFRHEFAAYYDLFRFPWLTYRADSPSQGSEALLVYYFRPSSSSQLSLRYRMEKKQQSVPLDSQPLPVLSMGRKDLIGWHVSIHANAWLSLETRIQYSQFNLTDKTTRGLAIVQDAHISLTRLKVTGRYSLFDTDDYENRQYFYERNVLYAYSIPSYYGTGSRRMIMAQFPIGQSLTAWLRFARFHYNGKSETGTGLDETKGPNRTDISIELQKKF
ncbi:MAG: helix-hairpin-helix domain-containing protein [Cyclobacteriaceae bacterium]|nr:helix-hairpin-helix domain-containing protein [Cyclobacteriaceae bacterium]